MVVNAWTMVSQVSRFESMHLIVVTGIKDKTILEQTQLLVRTEKQYSRRKCKYFKIRIFSYDEN
jgi:hypothetical protein